MADMTEERDSLSWSWTCDGAAIVRCRKGGDKEALRVDICHGYIRIAAWVGTDGAQNFK